MNHRLAVLTAVLAAAATSARADCMVRNLDAEEKAFYAKTYDALKTALPAAPEGWTMELRKDPEPSACDDDPKGRFDVTVRAEYRYRPSKEELASRDTDLKNLRKRIEKLDELPPEVKAERQVWLDKMSVANRAANAAEKAGDKAAASKANAESEQFSAKGREVRERFRATVRPKKEELEAQIKALGDQMAAVSVDVAANELFPFAPQPEFGAELRAGKLPAPREGGLKIFGARMIIEGPAARRKTIEALADRKKLEALVR